MTATPAVFMLGALSEGTHHVGVVLDDAKGRPVFSTTGEPKAHHTDGGSCQNGAGNYGTSRLHALGGITTA